MRYKLYRILTLSLLAFFVVSSCSEDYLDQKPDDLLTLEMTFNDENRVEGWLAALYNLIPDPYWTTAYGYGAVFLSDDAQLPMEQAEWGGWAVKAQQGNWSPTSEYAPDLWGDTYEKVRSALIFQQNVKALPEQNLTQDDVDQMILESRFLVAFYYSKMLEMYGPFPLVTDLISSDTDYDALMLQRTPYDEIVDWLDDELLEISEELPETYTNLTSDFGRPTKGTCLAIRARVLLNAASPLFNGNEDFKDVVNPDGTNLFSQSYDATKWDKAVEAYKLVIDLAEAGVYELYTETQDDGDIDPFLSFQNLFTKTGDTNKEIIWARPSNNGSAWNMASFPRGAGGYGFFGLTQSLVDAFYDRNGLDINDPASVYVEDGYSSYDTYYDTDYDQNWKSEAGMVVQDNVYNMYINREPRFYITVRFNRNWIPQESRDAQLHYGGYDGRPSADSPMCGYLNKKAVHPEAIPRSWYVPTMPGIMIRLGEIYLSYVEAMNESETYRESSDIIEYLNRIRTRAGIPGVDESLLGNYSEMQSVIRRERRVELAVENDIRYNDIRRWKTAVSIFSEPVTGMNQYASEPDFYNRTDVMTRTFTKKMYLYPIRQTYIDNNPNLVQNPNW